MQFTCMQYHNHHHRQHYIGYKRPMLHCHTTIRGRKYLALVIEGLGGVDLNIECLFIRQTPRRLHLESNKLSCKRWILQGAKRHQRDSFLAAFTVPASLQALLPIRYSSTFPIHTLTRIQCQSMATHAPLRAVHSHISQGFEPCIRGILRPPP